MSEKKAPWIKITIAMLKMLPPEKQRAMLADWESRGGEFAERAREFAGLLVLEGAPDQNE